MGVSEALKAPTADSIVALEPAGSPAITGGATGSFAMQGWPGIVPPHCEHRRVDDVWTIEDGEAIEMTARLAQEEGICPAVSAGSERGRRAPARRGARGRTRSS